MSEEGFLVMELLAGLGVAHGFGTRSAREPRGLRRPIQVHGARVARLQPAGDVALGEADAVVSTLPGVPVAVVTADCVPILLASESGRAVCAVHGGWRGLAGGVVEAGAVALAGVAPGERLRAAIGPHIGHCCYEVDEPVLDALRRRFGSALDRAARASRPGHAWLDLGVLAREALMRSGISPDAVASLPRSCTHCHPQLFHSYRRDGAAAGRMAHWIAARAESSRLDTPERAS